MKNEKKIITEIEENWFLASQRLSFEFICPYVFKFNNEEKRAFAFLPEYGSNNGMIVDLIFPPDFEIDQEIVEYAKTNGFYYSFINAQRYFDYDEDLFVETLRDWKI